MEIQTILANIQAKLNVPKNQRNNFGNYNYRSAEDILEEVKKLLEGAILTITDEVVMVGERYYVKATATLTAGKESISTVAYAREEESRKGMDSSQITGATSSYARKYALNGLFCIDDTKDADTMDRKEETKKAKVTTNEDTIELVSKKEGPNFGRRFLYKPATKEFVKWLD